ncbi:hypothetical protein HF526_12950 [Pseudonocardia sp. K10HN5]|uniref:Uncharacterized protein n=1 Tax=Pseudonocardia acidicola TaxID=2724939 RepID=A0ABX1S9G9_9PSEU|nr:hypothetical protein [Pseudonocardia acidicola]
MPCVLSCTGATQRPASGTVITVGGSTGTVTVG